MKNYTEADIIALRDRVRPYLTGKRYEHTLAVEREAGFLGKIYMPEKVMALRAAALLHDITKKCDFEKQLQICAKFDIIICDYDKLSPKTFHSKTAAAIIPQEFPEYDDEKIISAVRWHTTGHDGMTDFEAIVYLADYIEDTRTFPDCVKLRESFRAGLEAGEDVHVLLWRTMITSFDMTIMNLVKEGSLIDADTVTARSFYISKMKAHAETL